MTYTRFTRDQWWNFFYTADLIVGAAIGVTTAVVSWRSSAIASLVFAFLTFMAFGYFLPRLCRAKAVYKMESKGTYYRRDDYVISAAIQGWAFSLLASGGALWLLIYLG